MITKIRIIIVLISITSCYTIFCQEEGKKAFDSLIVDKALHFENTYFFPKAVYFFIAEEWDSTLVYTARQLVDISKKEKELKDYIHYIRGFSFSEKKLFKESQSEFNKVSADFSLKNLVSMRLGEVALELNQFKIAAKYYKSLLHLPDSSYTYFGKSNIYHNLGLTYLHLKEFDKSEMYLLENVRLEELEKDTLDIITAYINTANLYYEQYKDNLAIPYFEKAYQLSRKIKEFDTKQLTAINMAVVEENRKNFEKALLYRKEFEKWKDSINDQNKIYEVAQLEKEYAVKQKQQEVNLLEAENKAKIQERNGLLYSALTLLILLGITFYFYKEKNKANKIIVSAQKDKLDELNAAKDKLFSIVSHDLRSSVNALKTSNTKLLDNLESKNMDALENNLQSNSSIVNGAYSLLDNLLHWALLQTKQSYFHIEEVPVFFIVEQVAYNYIPIMEDKEISFENLVSKKDKVFADQESLKIVLRNLLDNAIKFSDAKGGIKIYTENDNTQYCNLIIEDLGIGVNEITVNRLLSDSGLLAKTECEDINGTGLGLQLCKSYISKNNGKFSIKSEVGKGSKMIVSLPKAKLNG